MKSTTIFSFLNRDAILPEKFIGKRFSVMNVFEETGNMEPQTIVLLDSTYEQYKKMWEDMILSYTKSQPESHNIDAKFGEFLSL